MKEVDKAWLAGLFLGEGSIQMTKPHRTKRGGSQIALRVAIFNGDELIIDKVCSMFPFKKYKHPYIRNEKNLYEFQAFTSSARAREFLSLIYPYLIGKKRKLVDLVLAFSKKRKTPPFHPYSIEEFRIVEEFWKLNQRPSAS